MKTHTIILLTLLPLLAGACRLYGGKEQINLEPPEPVQPVGQDSTRTFTAKVTLEADYPVRDAQILFYRSDGLKDLVMAVNSDGAVADVEFTDSLPKTAAVIANSKYRLNTAALGHFDSLDQLVYRLEDEDTQAPLMTGIGSVTPGENCRIRLSPLLCTVVLSEVTNLYEGDTLAEDPRVWLENANGETALFKASGFPVRDPQRTKAVRLPSDIGLYTQRPGTRLYCYPNDLPNPNPGNPATEIVLQYEANGETHSWRSTLHPIKRGETILVQAELRPCDEVQR